MSDSPYKSHPSFPNSGQINPNIGERPGPETYEAVSRRGTGKCLIYGCAGVFFGGLLLILCGGFGVYYFYMQQVDRYTAKAPMEVPNVDYSEEQISRLQTRVREFSQSVKKLEQQSKPVAAPPKTQPSDTQDPAPPQAQGQQLVLTADDLNALIAMTPQLAGKLFVTIDDDTITGETSIPLDGIVPGAKGRYFNGSGTFEVWLENGRVWVTLQEAQVKGESLPETFIEALRSKNLADDFQQTPEGTEFVQQFEQIEVKDGKVTLTLKSSSLPEDESPN